MLLSQGHPDAEYYTLAKLWSEVRLVKQRQVRQMRADALIMQSAILSVLVKSGGKAFSKLLESLDDGY